MSEVRYYTILWGGDSKSNKIFKLQKNVLQIISSVHNIYKYLKNITY
jgi:hypothetical protein